MKAFKEVKIGEIFSSITVSYDRAMRKFDNKSGITFFEDVYSFNADELVCTDISKSCTFEVEALLESNISDLKKGLVE